MPTLDGDVVLMAVPSEEYVEVEYRVGLKEQGLIEFLGGKPELIRLGAFDGIDLTFMTHQAAAEQGGVLGVGGPSNGCVVKQVVYTGRAAHAGGAAAGSTPSRRPRWASRLSTPTARRSRTTIISASTPSSPRAASW